jgi:hypothetical protein
MLKCFCDDILSFEEVMMLSTGDLAKWLKRLTANAEIVTVLGSIRASSEWRQMKLC